MADGKPHEVAPFAATHVPSASRAAPTEPDDDALIGQKVGDYVITERLGSGGQGVVYGAIQPVIGRPVAIKVLRPEVALDPEQAQRLFSEAQVARVRHRGIIDVFTLGQLADGRHCLVMEYLRGESLAEALRRRGAFPAREALELVDEALSALGAAHAAGIVHRDLKPSNVFLVTQSDGESYVKLLDFGLAKQSTAPSSETPQTRHGVFVGTPEYVAPEQARGAEVGPATDLYSLGVVLFELLTGRLPFVAQTPIEFILQHLEATPPLPSSLQPGLPPRLDALVLSLLAKEASQRPRSAAEVRAALATILRDAQLDPVAPAQSTGSGLDYTLRLGTRFELGLSWLVPSLRTLRRQAPERHLHLCFGDSPELVRQLRHGELDCAVTSARLRGDWLRAADLHEEAYVLVGTPGLALDPERLALADVHADTPLLRYLQDSHAPARAWQFAETDVLGTIAAVRHRLLEGDAVAVLPLYFVQRDLDAGTLQVLLPEVALQRDCFRLVWRDGHPRAADIERLAGELRALPLT